MILISFILKLLALNFFITWSGSDFLTTITVWAIIAYGIIEKKRFDKKISPIEINISHHVNLLSKFNNNAADDFENIKELFITNYILKDKWEEYEHTLIKREQPRIVYKTEPAEIEQNDKGVDVIVMPENQNEAGMLVQVKHASEERKVGPEAVKEVFTAKKLFERRYSVKFECSAITNTDFTSDAKELAAANDVILRNNIWLERELTGNNIYWASVRKVLLQRMDRV